MCTQYSCTVVTGCTVYSAVQAAPTGSGVTRVRAGQSGDRPRPVSRHRAQADIGHLIGRHLQAFIIRRALTKMDRGHHVPVLVMLAFSVRA